MSVGSFDFVDRPQSFCDFTLMPQLPCLEPVNRIDQHQNLQEQAVSNPDEQHQLCNGKQLQAIDVVRVSAR